ncbi:MAG: hypothetical protein KCHDKBKB_01488 [Elusimicrobia bacterium]|nr:hypothetical protein [Elusimicrobiota bacterium]
MPSPIGHALLGAWVGWRGPSNKIFSWWTGWGLFFALLPDFDFIPGLLMGEPFKYHRSITHSLGFLLAISFGTFAVLKVAGIKKLWTMTFISAGALLSHLMADYFCVGEYGSMGLPLFWPINSQYYSASVGIFIPLYSGERGQVISWVNLILLVLEFITGLLIVSGLSFGKRMPSWIFRKFLSKKDPIEIKVLAEPDHE